MRFQRHSLEAADPDITSGKVEQVLQEGVNFIEKIAQDFKDRIAKIKTKLEGLKSLVGNVKEALKGASYETSTKLEFLTDDKDGLVLDFGYVGSGPSMEGFAGFESDITITDIPEGFVNAVRGALSQIGLGDFTSITPAQEWLLKVVLLVKDRIEKAVTSRQFLREFFTLMSRLVFTPGLDTAQKILDSLSPILKAFFDKIMFKGSQKAVDIFNLFYGKVHAALQRPFSKKLINGEFVDDPSYVPNGSALTGGQARGVLFALCLKSIVSYAQLKFLYRKTDAGKAAEQGVVNATEEGFSSAVETFNAQLPKFSDLKNFVIGEFGKILGRLVDKAQENELIVFGGALLGAIGLPLSSLVEQAKALEYTPEPAGPVEQELGELDLSVIDPTSLE